MTLIELEQAVNHLKQGEVIAYPTEAVWGLGCDPFQQTAFDKILTLKQRPIEKGVILLSDNIERVEPLLADLDQSIRNQIIDSWQNQTKQQATTWLLPITDDIPAWIYGQHDRVAIRVTQHHLCQQLCYHFDNFIVSSSANPAGQTPATSQQQVSAYFPNTFILAGELGKSTAPSRILDAVTSKVIRP